MLVVKQDNTSFHPRDSSVPVPVNGTIYSCIRAPLIQELHPLYEVHLIMGLNDLLNQ